LGDLYGRRLIFLVSILIFLAGSALSGLSQNMSELIAFRAFQGIGAGGLTVGALATIGELVPPRERGKYQGYMAVIYAVALISGPLMGGVITQYLSWRWVFYINLPLGGLAFVVLFIKLRLPRHRPEGKISIDWFGSAVLCVGIVALLILMSGGGTRFSWGSSTAISLAVFTAAALLLFVWAERRATEPVLPLRLFRLRNFSLVFGLGFMLGFSLFGAVNFLPLYQQTVQGLTATGSGVARLPMLIGLLLVSILAGRLMKKTGRYKIFPIVGGIFMLAGAALLATINASTSVVAAALFMTVLGVGLGFLMQITTVIAQNSVELRDIGVASSMVTFSRSIGGILGISIAGTLFANQLTSSLTSRIGAAAARRLANGSRGSAAIDPSAINSLSQPVRHLALTAVAAGISSVFLWATVATVLIPVLAVFVKEVPLRAAPVPRRVPAQQAASGSPQESPPSVV
jgi:EmrB/QacA subfamily drug resistance transporter